MDARKRKLGRILLVTKLVVSAGLLGLLIHWISPRALLERYSDLSWGWVLLGIVALQIQTMISTAKWKIILGADNIRVPYLLLWKTYLISGFLSLFLPTSFGGDAYRIWTLNRLGAKVGKSAASVLFDRLTGMWALITIGTVGLSVLLGPRLCLPVVSVYVLGVAVFLVVTGQRVVSRIPQPKNKYLGFPVTLLRSFGLYRRSPRRLAAVLALAGVFQFNIVLIVFWYTKALGISSDHIQFTELVATVPAIYLTEMLPISINGIGVRDSAFAFFYERVGGTAAEGLAVSLLVIAVRYVSGLVGGILLAISVFQGRGIRRMDPASPGVATGDRQ